MKAVHPGGVVVENHASHSFRVLLAQESQANGVRQDLAEDDVRAVAWDDEESVLPDETEAGASRDFPFEERRGVDTDAETGAFRSERSQILDDGLQMPPHDSVVVLASGELRHVSRSAAGNRARHGEDGFREGQDGVEAQARRGMALEIRHLSVKSLVEPLPVPLERDRRGSGEDSGSGESVGARRIDRGPGEAGGVVGKGRGRPRNTRGGGPHGTSVYQVISYHPGVRWPLAQKLLLSPSCSFWSSSSGREFCASSSSGLS